MPDDTPEPVIHAQAAAEAIRLSHLGVRDA